MTLNELYREAIRRCQAAGCDSPAFDAACLLEKHMGVTRQQLLLRGAEPADAAAAQRFLTDIDRRAAGEPLQYILGQWEFMGLRFRVGPGVLIPRPETELLCETAIDFLKSRTSPRMLELCAGSGCVSVSAALAVPSCRVDCLELSGDAIGYLQKNIALHQLGGRVSVIAGDMLCYDTAPLARAYDVIVCNPPYIRSGDIPSLQHEVRLHEPAMALDGGADGLLFYRAFTRWRGTLRPGGMAAFEAGAGQAGDIADILGRAGLGHIFIRKDYAGIDRVVGGYAGAAENS